MFTLMTNKHVKQEAYFEVPKPIVLIGLYDFSILFLFK